MNYSSSQSANSKSDKTTSREATVGIKADVKTLQQLSSSGRAAQNARKGRAAASSAATNVEVEISKSGSKAK